ncbi:hypothetical protein SCP_0203630 [Sparassis crispa]|uniref:Uncharacterized protein n=1 Tax=Sparassis crispa TaxID=139825 RepID=A0A401GAE9_9APHY|nr:hypothetical protein SCP_0203630 [Sparassis crispa]GBE79166.1 hypothetical protein SCP_0203630 [Sparassis crispa]
MQWDMGEWMLYFPEVGTEKVPPEVLVHWKVSLTAEDGDPHGLGVDLALFLGPLSDNTRIYLLSLKVCQNYEGLNMKCLRWKPQQYLEHYESPSQPSAIAAGR